jgi:hypothetical protein
LWQNSSIAVCFKGNLPPSYGEPKLWRYDTKVVFGGIASAKVHDENRIPTLSAWAKKWYSKEI